MVLIDDRSHRIYRRIPVAGLVAPIGLLDGPEQDFWTTNGNLGMLYSVDLVAKRLTATIRFNGPASLLSGVGVIVADLGTAK